MDRPRREPGGGKMMDELEQKVEASFQHVAKEVRVHIYDFLMAQIAKARPCAHCHHTTQAPRLRERIAELESQAKGE